MGLLKKVKKSFKKVKKGVSSAAKDVGRTVSGLGNVAKKTGGTFFDGITKDAAKAASTAVTKATAPARSFNLPLIGNPFSTFAHVATRTPGAIASGFTNFAKETEKGFTNFAAGIAEVGKDIAGGFKSLGPLIPPAPKFPDFPALPPFPEFPKLPSPQEALPPPPPSEDLKEGKARKDGDLTRRKIGRRRRTVGILSAGRLGAPTVLGVRS